MKHFTILIFALLIIQNSWAQIENVDPGFGNNGVASAEFNNAFDEAFSSLVLPSGKILIAGRTSVQPDRPIILAMFLANGQPDNSFGTNGKKTIPTNQNGIISLRTPLLQTDGKIIIPGNLNVNNITRRMAVRILANGDLDNTFGNNGFFVSNNALGAIGEDLVECFLLPDGKI